MWSSSYVQIRSVRWQQQAEWRRTGINFAETSGQRRPDEDMLREEDIYSSALAVSSRCWRPGIFKQIWVCQMMLFLMQPQHSAQMIWAFLCHRSFLYYCYVRRCVTRAVRLSCKRYCPRSISSGKRKGTRGISYSEPYVPPSMSYTRH